MLAISCCYGNDRSWYIAMNTEIVCFTLITKKIQILCTKYAKYYLMLKQF